MFAIHYFFESRDVARSFFAHVASVLEPGKGIFIGTFPDGHRVLEAAAATQQNALMSIRFHEEDNIKPFGTAYTITIVDTVVDRDGSREFLVFPETLLELAAEVGLEPIADYDTGTLLDPRDRRKCIRHFASRHPDPHGRAVSALFATFAFRKLPS